MPSSYSNSLKIQLMANGEDSGTWGDITNTNWNLIEQSVAGVQSITMANANYTLSNLNGVSDEARNMVLNVTGTNSAIYQVIAPLVQKFYVISNNTVGGYAITIGASTGPIIVIPNGTTGQVFCDGSTGFYSSQTTSAGNFLVNGNFSCTGNEVDVGNMTIGGTLGVVGAVTLSSTSTAPTPTTGDSSTNIATTAFVQNSLSSYIPAGTRLVFAQAAAPTGWTQDTSDTANNRMMRVVNTTGGGVGGSSDPTLMNVVPIHTHGFSGTTATENAAHNHTWGSSSTTGTMNSNTSHSHGVSDPGHAHSVGGTFQAYGNPNISSVLTQIGNSSTGAAATNISIQTTGIDHTHNFSLSGTTSNEQQNHAHTYSGSTDNGSSQTNWTPRYVNLIICQKN